MHVSSANCRVIATISSSQSGSATGPSKTTCEPGLPAGNKTSVVPQRILKLLHLSIFSHPNPGWRQHVSQTDAPRKQQETGALGGYRVAVDTGVRPVSGVSRRSGLRTFASTRRAYDRI
jgi:hypothetical protein